MGLAFDAIELVVYPVAMGLSKSGMERYHVTGEIFYLFGTKYDIPENKLNTAMIYLSITCVEKDYINNKERKFWFLLLNY